MSERVWAATQVGARKMELRDYPMPEISADDALLKVEVAGICGSDIGGYQNFPGEPRIRGHENVGFLAKIGAAAAQRWGVKEGDRVVIEQYLPCGTCRWCRIGEYRFCDQTDKLPGRTILRYGNTPVSVVTVPDVPTICTRPASIWSPIPCRRSNGASSSPT